MPEPDYSVLNTAKAPFTWEVQADLLASREQTSRVSLPLGRPVHVVGAYASVRLLAIPGDPVDVPTIDDVLVLLETDQGSRITNSETGVGAGASGSFVTLGAMTTANNVRLIDWQLDYASPVIQVTFRWRTVPAIYGDVSCALSLFCKPLDGRR